MKKIVHAFVCIFAVLFIFAACSADSGDSGSSEKSSESETVEKKTEPDKKEPETDKQTVYYTLTLDANGGTGSASYKEIKAGQQFVLKKATELGVTRTDYTFWGWASNSSAETATYSDGGTVVINSNTTLYAVWKKNAETKTDTQKENQSEINQNETKSDSENKSGETTSTTESNPGTQTGEDNPQPVSHTVTFDTNGGSDIPAKTVSNGETVTEPVAPTKDGYVFKGWYTSSNFSSPYTFGNTISDDITLYAKWQNTAGVTITVSSNSTVAITKTEDGSTITLTATSGHSSYTWKIDDNVAENFDGASVEENTLTITKSKLVEGYRYQISLYAPKDGIPYSAEITVKKGE